MDALFWAALGFLVVATIVGGVFVGLRAWRAWQAFVSFAAGVGAGIDRLLAGAERLAAQGELTAARAQDLNDAVESLARARARLRVLLAALTEVRELVYLALRVVPQK